MRAHRSVSEHAVKKKTKACGAQRYSFRESVAHESASIHLSIAILFCATVSSLKNTINFYLTVYKQKPAADSGLFCVVFKPPDH